MAFFNKHKKPIIIVLLVLTLTVTATMNAVLLPAITAEAGGLPCFDMRMLGYGEQEVAAFLSALSARGRDLYLHAQLPLDFVYPVLYTLLFCALLTALRDKATKLLALPLLLAVFDYGENVCLVRLLSAGVTAVPVSLASTFTVVKSLLMVAVFALILVLFCLRLAGKRKKKRAE